VRNGHIKRITDNDIQSSVIEIMSTNISTTFVSCPADPTKTLGIKLPFLVMIIKNVRTAPTRRRAARATQAGACRRLLVATAVFFCAGAVCVCVASLPARAMGAPGARTHTHVGGGAYYAQTDARRRASSASLSATRL